MDLSGRNAIVTGGAVRVGRAIAMALARNGMNVCLHYSSSSNAAAEAVEDLRGLGVRAESVQADFINPVAAARTVMGFVAERFGNADVLVNSAAVFDAGTVTSIDEAHWDRQLDINLKAPFFLTQEFVRLAGDSPSARRDIVNIVDWRGTVPVAGHVAYTISKAALVAQTQILAQELGPAFRVNAVAPGAILPAPGTNPAVFEGRRVLNPLQQTGHPDDVADAVLFLLRSRFISGEVIHVTGGEQLSPGQKFGSDL